MPSGFDVHVLGPDASSSAGMFVLDDATPKPNERGTYSFPTPTLSPGNGPRSSPQLSILRPSSVAILRPNDDPLGLDSFDTGRGHDGDGNKPSWYEKPELELSELSCGDLMLLFLETLVLSVVPVGILLAAIYADQVDVLPYIYSVLVAAAGHEFGWLAYRARVRLFLPFKLHEKQTSRELYKQIIAYSVDLHTAAVTPLAEKLFGGRKRVAAFMLATFSTGIAVALCFLPSQTAMPVAYTAMSTFLGVGSAALAPNLPAAIGAVIRYAYYFLASLNVLLTKDKGAIEDKYLAVVLEPFSLLLVGAGVLLITRVLTCQDAMESTVLAVLDLTGLLYISCFAAVLEFFSRSPAVDTSHALVGFLVICWSSELGSFLLERTLKAIQFPWTHPLAKRVSSRQNFEKLVGAVGCGVGATFLIAEVVDFDMDTPYVALLAAGAVIFSQMCKLLLMSLKKIAKVTVTGKYHLRVGGGVLDRMDTLLFMAVVFCPFFQRSLYDDVNA